VYETGDKIIGGANFAKSPDGTVDWVLVGSYDASLHCVEAATGKAVWTTVTDNYINGTPALLPGGEIIFGGCDSLLRIVSVKDGKQQRQIEVDSYVASSVAVASDGKAYVGHYGNAVLGLDPAQAKILWTYRDRGFPYLSSAAVSGDRVIIGGNDKRVHCIGRTDGKSLWQFSTRGKVDGSPVVCGDTAVVGAQDGRLYGISLEDGAERWVYDLGAPVSASPAVSDGWLVIGAEDGAVHALRWEESKP
jgi:outer membrane protein assembly factor BamB